MSMNRESRETVVEVRFNEENIMVISTLEMVDADGKVVDARETSRPKTFYDSFAELPVAAKQFVTSRSN